MPSQVQLLFASKWELGNNLWLRLGLANYCLACLLALAGLAVASGLRAHLRARRWLLMNFCGTDPGPVIARAHSVHQVRLARLLFGMLKLKPA